MHASNVPVRHFSATTWRLKCYISLHAFEREKEFWRDNNLNERRLCLFNFGSLVRALLRSRKQRTLFSHFIWIFLEREARLAQSVCLNRKTETKERKHSFEFESEMWPTRSCLLHLIRISVSIDFFSLSLCVSIVFIDILLTYRPKQNGEASCLCRRHFVALSRRVIEIMKLANDYNSLRIINFHDVFTCT